MVQKQLSYKYQVYNELKKGTACYTYPAMRLAPRKPDAA